MIFVGLAFVIVAMGAVQEIPQVVSTLFSSESNSETLTHDDVRSMLQMFRTVGGGLSGGGGAGSSASGSGAGAGATSRIRLLQEAQTSGGETPDAIASSPTSSATSGVDDYTVQQAFEVKRRLSVFYTLMYLFKLLIASVTLYSACRALQQWRDYKLSAKWTILALTVRLVVTVFLSWLPWFYMLFPDENERPEFLNVITWGQMVMLLAGKRYFRRWNS